MPWIRAWSLILRFYFTWLPRFGRMHPDVPTGRLFPEAMAKSSGGSFEVALSSDFQKEFNNAYADLKASLAQLLGLESAFVPILIGCWLVRSAQCFIVWAYGPFFGLLAGLGQFIVAPLSLTSSFVRLMTNLSDCIMHYLFTALALAAVLITLQRFPQGHGGAMLDFVSFHKVRVDTTFVVVFFVTDFVANLYHYLASSEAFGLQRLMTHIAYGSFNTKTYFVVVLGCLFGFEFDIIVIAITGMLQYIIVDKGLHAAFFNKLGLPCFAVTFYLEHRIGHCPVVYTHAHKMHHYLHDTTAFDAHIYGSGMNEEFFWILAETLPCLLSQGLLFPYWLNPYVLYVSWTNKSGHTRTAAEDAQVPAGCDADNFHADHHTLHRANFGLSSSPMLDFYFGTQCTDTRRVEGRSWEIRPDPENAEKVICRVAPMAKEKIVEKTSPEPEAVAAAFEAVAAVGQMNDWQSRTISLQELAAKKTAADGGPWVALHGVVFDLRIFHRVHPGGPGVLLQYAGSDATSTFDEIGHSEQGREMSRKYAIGRLEGSSITGYLAE